MDKTAAGEGRNGSSYFVEEEKQPVEEEEQVGKGVRDQLVSCTPCFPKHISQRPDPPSDQEVSTSRKCSGDVCTANNSPPQLQGCFGSS